MLKRFNEAWMILLEVINAMFQVLNKTIQDNASLLENACFVVMVVYFLGYDSYLLHNGYACHYVKIMNLLFCGVHMC